jgi:hypothetical protein
MYNSGFASLVSGSLDAASLKAAVRMLCQRHEVTGGWQFCRLVVLQHALNTLGVLTS